MALLRGRGTTPHVPIIFFLPFCLMFLDVDVDAVVLWTPTPWTLTHWTPWTLTPWMPRLATKTPTAAYVGDDCWRFRRGEVRHPTSQ